MFSLLLGRSPSMDLTSQLSPEQCVERLRASVDAPFDFFGSKEVVGSIRAGAFAGQKRIGYRNDFQTVVTAKFYPMGRATTVSCKFGMSRWVTAFMTFWLGGVSIIGVFLILNGLLDQGAPLDSRLAFIFGPTIMLGGAYLLLRFGRWLARDERQFLIDFLCETLQAQPIP